MNRLWLRAELWCRREHVVHEIYRPSLIWGSRNDAFFTHHRRPPALGRFGANGEVFFAVDTAHALSVDLPALAPQERRNPFVSTSNPDASNLFDAGTQDRIVGLDATIVHHFAIDVQ